MNLQPIPQISNRDFADVSEKLSPSNIKDLYKRGKRIVEVNLLIADAEALKSQLHQELIDLERMPIGKEQAS